MLEEFLDGTLTERQKSVVEEHLKECPACVQELQGASGLVEALRTLPEVRCPDRAVRLIEDATRQRKPAMSSLEKTRTLGDFPFWKTSSVVAAGAVVLLLLVLTLTDRDKPSVPQYTKQEALEARTVARNSLVQVVGIINRTERKAVSGFLKDNLSGTIRKTIRKVAPFQKGGKA
jgi:anti-sigma factor RsiW